MKTRSKYKIENFSGKTINSWTIVSFSHQDDQKQLYWNVVCVCGDRHKVRASHIFRNLSKRCKKCGKKSHAKVLWKGGEFISSSFFVKYKGSAKRRKIKFDLTIEQLENKWRQQNGLCAYTGIKLTLPQNSRDESYNASIDRIDSKLPYTISNIEWVIKEVNVMKQSYSKKEFLNICHSIVKNK